MIPKDYHLFDKQYPTKIRHLKNLIDRTYSRCPSIPRDRIEVIIRVLIATMREQFVAGEEISLKVIQNLHLYKIKGRNAYIAKIRTPKAIKERFR